MGLNVMTNSQYQYLNSAINGMLGQLTVAMMKYRDPDIREVHTHLLEVAAWLDEADAVPPEILP